MKKVFFLFFTFFAVAESYSQDSLEIKRVAFFAPLHLDTLFDGTGNFKPNSKIPPHVKTGLEFYQAAMMAVDSIDREGHTMEVEVFDTRKKGFSIFSIADNGKLDGTGLILGAVSGKEYLDLATIAKEKKIPFVSVSYPNDGGITNNPWVIVANSKLNTHLQRTYNYILSNLGTSKLSMISRPGNADKRITDVFNALNASQSGSVLNIRSASVATNVNNTDVEALLDKDRENVLICASLDDNFAKRLINAAVSLSQNYKITLIGMPTWESFIDADKTDTRNLSIVYPSTLYNPGAKENEWVNQFSKAYGMATYTRPTELAFHSYELTYIFMHLLQRYNHDLMNHIGEKQNYLITDYDFKPIRGKNSVTTDYYENKRVYMLKLAGSKLDKAE